MRIYAQIILFAGAFLYQVCALAHFGKMTFVVETALVKEGPFEIKRRYMGSIMAEEFSLLSTKASGVVEKIMVKANQEVKKGQILITLKRDYEEENLKILEDSLKLANDQYLRSLALHKSKDITKSALEKSESELLSLKAKVSEAKKHVEDLAIIAPFDGRVGVPRVSLGQTVTPKDVLLSIQGQNKFVTVPVPASRLQEINEGQELAGKWGVARVSAVERSIDPKTRMGFFKGRIDACDQCIVGESAYATVTIKKSMNAIVINRTAIYLKDRKSYAVVVKADDKGNPVAEVREITYGEVQDGRVEILSGLKDGEEIIIADPKRVPDKANVTVFKKSDVQAGEDKESAAP